ncbi:MAG: sensor histidine kinase [Flammeovirgaceae bacterium]|jgi:sensor histidine kinase YesM|nr:sensor histidine kinase [Flammeovirgaceae bacterium]
MKSFLESTRLLKSTSKWLVLFAIASVITVSVILNNAKFNYAFITIAIQPLLATLYFIVVAIGHWLGITLFSKRKYLRYIVSLILLVALGAATAEYVSPFAGPDFGPISLNLHVISLTFILLLAAYAQSVREFIGRRVEMQEYRYQKAQAELQLLKRQLNPHFLFNTLNSIYFKATRQSNEAAEMILKLSDLLRYQLKMETTDEVTLQEEVDFLQHYIYFEKRRLPPNMTVAFSCQIDTPKLKVAPNMLMTLVENAFKHGVLAQHVGVIYIELIQKNGSLLVQTFNPIGDLEMKRNGTGIENLKKRLDFLYPNRHTLTFDKKENTFHASLQIEL